MIDIILVDMPTPVVDYLELITSIGVIDPDDDIRELDNMLLNIGDYINGNMTASDIFLYHDDDGNKEYNEMYVLNREETHTTLDAAMQALITLRNELVNDMMIGPLDTLLTVNIIGNAAILRIIPWEENERRDYDIPRDF